MSARLHAAQFHEALQAYALFTAWWGGWIPVKLGQWAPYETAWRRLEDDRRPRRSLAHLVRSLDENNDDEILLGMPWSSLDAGGVAVASVLWAKVEGADQLARARKLRPLPSLVLQEGSSSRRWLLWPLERVTPYLELKSANRRLAYALKATQKWGDPDVVWIPAPGTCLREGRSRPSPVRVARLDTTTFADAGAVVGRLKEPPEVKPWWESA